MSQEGLYNKIYNYSYSESNYLSKVRKALIKIVLGELKMMPYVTYGDTDTYDYIMPIELQIREVKERGYKISVDKVIAYVYPSKNPPRSLYFSSNYITLFKIDFEIQKPIHISIKITAESMRLKMSEGISDIIFPEENVRLSSKVKGVQTSYNFLSFINSSEARGYSPNYSSFIETFNSGRKSIIEHTTATVMHGPLSMAYEKTMGLSYPEFGFKRKNYPKLVKLS